MARFVLRRGEGVLRRPIDQKQPGPAKGQSHHAAEKTGGEAAQGDGKEAEDEYRVDGLRPVHAGSYRIQAPRYTAITSGQSPLGSRLWAIASGQSRRV